MTYGWAILIVIIVGIVLWQSGVFGVQSGGISGFQGGVAVTDYTASGNLTLYVQNVAGEPLRDINVSGDCDAGATFSLGIGRDKNDVDLVCTPALSTTSGDSFSVDLTITYTTTVSGLTKTETGTISGAIS